MLKKWLHFALLTIIALTTMGSGCKKDEDPPQTAAGPTFTLTASKSGGGGGTLTSSPGGIDCGADCTQSYDSGIAVTVTATPDGSSVFVTWSGACSGAGVCSPTMDADKTATAVFQPPTLNIVASLVTSTGADGTITSNPAGIDCGLGISTPTACTASFSTNSNVTLTFTPFHGDDFFTGWGGDCASASGNTCTLTIDAAKNVVANVLEIPS